MASTASSNWDALKKRLDNVKKPIRTFALCEDPEIRERYRAAQRTSEDANTYLTQVKAQADKADAFDPEALAAVEKQAKDAKAELAAAQKAYDAATITLRFQTLEQQELDDLQEKHKPSEEDEAEGLNFAFDTFAPALISAASLDGMPAEDAARYLKTWGPEDSADLWRAAWSIQHVKRTDLGKG
jgi:hypothetical protein